MLLTNINTFKLTIDDIEIYIIFNFKTLENLYNLILDKTINEKFNIGDITPFDFIEKLDKEDNKINNLSILLSCMCEGKLDIYRIKNVIGKFDNNSLYELLKMTKWKIKEQILFDDQDEKSNKENLDLQKETYTKNTIKDFEDYFNYFYIIATTVLNYSIDEFYKATPHKLKACINTFNLNQQNILIKVYNGIIGANNTEKSKDNNKIDKKVETVKDANTFFALI